MAADFGFKVMNAGHRLMLKVSGGKLGWSALRMPVLELTTTGRKTGRQHTVMLTSPLVQGSTYVVVAARGGDDRTPAWFLNLSANPEVEVALKGPSRRRVKAKGGTPAGPARRWPRVAADHKNYAGYHKKTDREIPLVPLDLSDAA